MFNRMTANVLGVVVFVFGLLENHGKSKIRGKEGKKEKKQRGK